MKHCGFLALAVGVFGLLATVASHSAQAQEAVTVQGEVLDLACYLAKDKKGAEHKSCAAMCAKAGLPIGVLTDGGDLYLLIDDHDNNEPYDAAKKLAGSRAEIQGKKFVKHGMASILVTGAKAL
ncbi:MAG: hypothetical protein HY699_24330 [Deltaproteobacteria bacterium]|nr:hypothetical protein [Deltaproteobacteria bacterium]